VTDTQREALAALAEVCALSPDIRLGQLMAHLDFLAENLLGKGLGYIEDDELIALLYRHRAELTARLEGMPDPSMQQAGGTTSLSGSSTLSDAAQKTKS
jgi:hypothetical protein